MNSRMNKIGLALSGGGFRASLYHLGLVRLLRDGGILPQVTHITSVSGGSIFAGHLVLNWDRYNGSPSEFDAAASEFLSFVRLDVRNRITRRFPLTLPLRWPRRLLGRSNRKLTRTGLLEYYYEKYLYGDTSLFELPEKPALHLLATNLSEGCLCSFNRNGLLMVHRQPGNTFRIDRIHIGLATVPMAVTASSAFPGFFPPLELTGVDVGANAGEFGRQAYTDGGVFDNLGVRMFGLLERPLLAESPLSRDDFFDFREFCDALGVASKSGQEAPLGRLAQILVAERSRPNQPMLTDAGTSGAASQTVAGPGPVEILHRSTHSPGAGDGDGDAVVLSALWDLMRHYPFHREPLFAGLRPMDPDAEALLHQSGRVLDSGDQLWLNRHLLEAAFRQATGHPCFRRLDSGLDGVLVSDVGKPIAVQGNRRAGGLIRTALRATDILMDRVWQLEIETFRDTPGFVFAPITEVVEPTEDPTALHPEIQRQAAHVRTDLDRFSLLEISSLVRHGYCVGRKACRARPDLFGAELPDDAPWDPIPGAPHAAPEIPTAARQSRRFRSPQLGRRLGGRDEPAAATVEARTLQASALRRIWSTLLDPRDWATYVYVPLLVPILVLLPYFGVKYYQRSHRISQLVESLAQGSPDLQRMSHLLEGPMEPWIGEPAEEVPHLDEPDLTGFEILQDSRILDLRKWTPTASGESASGPLVYGYRRLKIFKQPENTRNNLFRMRLLPISPLTQVRFPPQQLQPRLRMSKVEGAVPGARECRWEASVDFRRVPAGDYVDLIYEHLSPGMFLRHGAGWATVSAEIRAKTAELTRWILLPEGKAYRSFRIIRCATGKPETAEDVEIVTEYLAEDNTILAYKLLSLEPGYTYEVTWYYE